MIYTVELELEVARAIETKAANQNLTPEEFVARLVERSVQPNIIADEQLRKSMEFIFTKYAPAFEALAESERNDRLAGN